MVREPRVDSVFGEFPKQPYIIANFSVQHREEVMLLVRWVLGWIILSLIWKT